MFSSSQMPHICYKTYTYSFFRIYLKDPLRKIICIALSEPINSIYFRFSASLVKIDSGSSV